jgi:hypothetical protein
MQMLTWSRVSWTQAEQVLDLLDTSHLGRRIVDLSPKDYFDALVAAGALDGAVLFLGMALPAVQSVRWACHILGETRAPGRHPFRDQLFAAAEDWLARPDDVTRRALWTAATQTPQPCPERLLAGAIFFSGGSIAPPDQASLAPPREVSGKLAGNAVLAAALETDHPNRILRRALAFGDRLAIGSA